MWGVVYFGDGENNILTDNITDIDHITYTIRIPRDSVPGTRSNQPGYWSPGSKNSDSRMKYFSGGFIYLQNMIDNGFIALKVVPYVLI